MLWPPKHLPRGELVGDIQLIGRGAWLPTQKATHFKASIIFKKLSELKIKSLSWQELKMKLMQGNFTEFFKTLFGSFSK